MWVILTFYTPSHSTHPHQHALRMPPLNHRLCPRSQLHRVTSKVDTGLIQRHISILAALEWDGDNEVVQVVLFNVVLYYDHLHHISGREGEREKTLKVRPVATNIPHLRVWVLEMGATSSVVLLPSSKRTSIEWWSACSKWYKMTYARTYIALLQYTLSHCCVQYGNSTEFKNTLELVTRSTLWFKDFPIGLDIVYKS